MTTEPEHDTQDPYHPIDCSLHDRYEAWAVRRTSLRVEWSEAGEVRSVESVRIEDVVVAGGAEYLVLSDRQRVRLDRIVSVAPLPPD